MHYAPEIAPRLTPVHLDAWRAVLRAHATVVGRAEQALAGADLPPLSWYDVLTALENAPERRLRMGELAQEVTLSRSGLVRLVDRIEAAGLVRRESVPDDRRGAYAVLTDTGARTLARMWPVYGNELQRTFAERVDPAEAEEIARVLARVSDTDEARV